MPMEVPQEKQAEHRHQVTQASIPTQAHSKIHPRQRRRIAPDGEQMTVRELVHWETAH